MFACVKAQTQSRIPEPWLNLPSKCIRPVQSREFHEPGLFGITLRSFARIRRLRKSAQYLLVVLQGKTTVSEKLPQKDVQKNVELLAQETPYLKWGNSRVHREFPRNSDTRIFRLRIDRTCTLRDMQTVLMKTTSQI